MYYLQKFCHSTVVSPGRLDKSIPETYISVKTITKNYRRKMKKITTDNGIWPEGLTIVRIITGIFLIVHGTQMFRSGDMQGYEQWLTDLHFPIPLVMAYVGKAAELFGGLCFILGLFVRLASITLIVTFSTITFFMGGGKIFTDAQHPFMFVLLAAVYLFAGSGKWSLDAKLFGIR
jgi:putative oxidoreductase